MKLLAIESAFEGCSVALWLDGAILERVHDEPRGHAARLLPFVEGLLLEGGIGLAELDAVAFSRGPGSFTSLRIGIGVVQGLAWGADLPVWPVSSLRTVAQGVVDAGVERAVVAMDARMNEVFSGRFRCEGGRMQADGPEWVGPADRALPDDPARWTGVGNGFDRFEVLANGPVVQRFPSAVARASVLAELAAAEWDPALALSADQAQPVYLRDRVAEKPASPASGAPGGTPS